MKKKVMAALLGVMALGSATVFAATTGNERNVNPANPVNPNPNGRPAYTCGYYGNGNGYYGCGGYYDNGDRSSSSQSSDVNANNDNGGYYGCGGPGYCGWRR